MSEVPLNILYVRRMSTLCDVTDFCIGRKEGRKEENEVGRRLVSTRALCAKV